MGKTILELFQSETLNSSGKTAEETYAVRNSKDIRVGASSYPLIDNTGFALARTVRKTDALTALKRETLIEEEVTGVRIIRAASAPILYGTDLIRVTTQSTPMVTTMKDSTFIRDGEDSREELPGGGALGGAISKGREKFTNGLSKLGVELPQAIIPTKIFQNSEYKKQLKNDIFGIPQKLAEIRKDAAGNAAGQFLKESAKGTPKQIGGQVIGNAIKVGKNKVRGKLFGEGSTTAFNDIGGFTGQGVSYNYGPKESNVNFRGGVTPSLEQAALGRKDSDGGINAEGVRYSKTIFRNFQSDNEVEKNIRLNAFRLWHSGTSESDITEESNSFRELNDELREEGGMISKIPELYLPSDDLERGTKIRYSKDYDDRERELYLDPSVRDEVSGVPKKIALKSKIKSKINDTFRFKVFGGDKNSNIDRHGVYDGETLPDGFKEENVDFIPFKFYSIAQNKTVQFRATVTGVAETISPSWESANFIGNPFNYYTYSGVERSVQISFKVYSLSLFEHNKMWEKLNFLAYQTYPQDYVDNLGMVPPIIKFTLGDMYVKKVGFIESLSFTQDDDAGWEIGMGGDSDLEKSSKTTKLPRVIEVSTTIKFIENKAGTFNKNLYGYKGVG